jgi:hypothetical protein
MISSMIRLDGLLAAAGRGGCELGAAGGPASRDSRPQKRQVTSIPLLIGSGAPQ